MKKEAFLWSIGLTIYREAFVIEATLHFGGRFVKLGCQCPAGLLKERIIILSCLKAGRRGEGRMGMRREGSREGLWRTFAIDRTTKRVQFLRLATRWLHAPLHLRNLEGFLCVGVVGAMCGVEILRSNE